MGGSAEHAPGENSSTAVLAIEDLQVSLDIGGQAGRVIKDLSYSLGRGEMLGVVGESGSGKSMHWKAVTGLLPASMTLEGGRVTLDGIEIQLNSPAKRELILGSEIAVVSQDPMGSLNPRMTIGGQMVELLRYHLGLTKKQAIERASELLNSVGIPDSRRRLADYPYQFSGGMAQRVVIAMAIALSPKVLFADEPTTALDVSVQAGIVRLFRQLQADTDLAVVLITHDIALAASICDRLAVMYGGTIVELGNSSAVVASPVHPYTKALVELMPDLDDKNQKLKPIPGSPPEPHSFPSGCAYNPRCPEALECCIEEEPSTVIWRARSFKCHAVALQLDGSQLGRQGGARDEGSTA